MLSRRKAIDARDEKQIRYRLFLIAFSFTFSRLAPLIENSILNIENSILNYSFQEIIVEEGN